MEHIIIIIFLLIIVVRVQINGSVFTMNAGSKITGNYNISSGGGVNVRDGAFTMNGGEISGNTANVGGGVYVLNSTDAKFFMPGGTITGNTATGTGYGNALYKGAGAKAYYGVATDSPKAADQIVGADASTGYTDDPLTGRAAATE
ncbi:hypothetical protein AGMMS50293_27160 [Spirochaetia bacterium]|nr:hypothetical protein AGMMS50293_27160 [Spirochaetia bacterium]